MPAVLITYILILPCIESPDWCNDNVENSDRFHFWIDCRNLGYPYSRLPTIGPFFTTMVDIFCVVYLAFVKWYKNKWREQTKYDRARNYYMIAIFGVSLVDLSFSIILLKRPIVSAFLRPFILASCMSSVRSNFFTLVQQIKDSSVILLSIFLFVFCYSAIGNFVF